VGDYSGHPLKQRRIVQEALAIPQLPQWMM
jgi:hypothetical protein